MIKLKINKQIKLPLLTLSPSLRDPFGARERGFFEKVLGKLRIIFIDFFLSTLLASRCDY